MTAKTTIVLLILKLSCFQITILFATVALGQSPREESRPPARSGIATGFPNQVYHAVGRGLVAILKDRMPILLDKSSKSTETYDFQIVCSESGSLGNVIEVANEQDSKARKGQAQGLEAKEEYLIFDSEGSERVSVRLGLINSFILKPLKTNDGKDRKGLRDKVRGLAVLWDDYLHLVVGPHVEIINQDGFETLKKHHQGKGPLRIYAKSGSAVQLIAKGLLDDPSLKGCCEVDVPKFQDVAQALIDRKIDVAFILSGAPNPVVERALIGGCHLLHVDLKVGWGHGPELEEPTVDQKRLVDILKKTFIPPRTYPNQERSEISTLGSNTLLIAANTGKKRLENEEADAILRAIFDQHGGKVGLETLVEHHEAAQEIRLQTNLEEYQTQPKDRGAMLVDFHPGVQSFFEKEAQKLKIAAGPVGGASFRVGVAIADSLERRQIPARALNTDGSKESSKVLEAGRANLAILENDVAIGSYDRGTNIRLVSFLYPQVFHFVARQSGPAGDQHSDGGPKMPDSLKNFLALATQPKIALARNSGDLDERILEHYAKIVGKAKPDPAFLPVALAQNRLISGEIEAALFSSGIPMENLKPLLGSDSVTQVPRLGRAALTKGGKDFAGVRVLPLDVPPHGHVSQSPRDTVEVPSILGLVANEPFLSPSIIPPETYPHAQGERTETVAVQIILACREKTADVYNIARSLIEDEVQLRQKVRGLTLRDPLERGEPSIPIHKDALRYYQAKNFVVRLPEPERTWSEATLAYLIQQLPGFLAGFLSAVIIPLLSTKVRDKLQKWLTEKEFAGLSEKAQKIYFTREIPLREKPKRLSELWIEIVVKYEHGELRAKDVGRLDQYIRECRERLLEDLKSEAGPTT